MKIDEAIRVLQNYPPGACPDDSIEFNQAILVGIEALKQVKESRVDSSSWTPQKLHGETNNEIVHCPDCGEYLGDRVNGVLYKFGKAVTSFTEQHKCQSTKSPAV